VIKRLDLSRNERRRPDWPSRNEPSDGHLFSSRTPLRKIVVLVDAELLADIAPVKPSDPRTVDPRMLLAGLLDHPLVRLYRYADDGPPSTVERTTEAFGATVYKGWAVLTDREPREGVWEVVYPTDGGSSMSAVIGNAPDVAANDTKTDVYRELNPQIARERRRADVLAAQVASQALQADIYVTERQYLHRPSWRVADGVTLCRPEEALPILSLYFRAQGEFLIAPRFRFNRGLFFWVGTRELLPEAWRWFSACVQHATASGDDGLLLLGGSLLQRVDRALEARDAIHVALNQPQNNDLREDALANLDVVLVLLMGAVDVAARVAHRVLGLSPASEFSAAWQARKKNGWLDLVRARRPTLAAVVDAGTPHERTLTILRLLRNSVHGAALQGMGVLRRGAPRESLVGLPADDEATLLGAMNALGGPASWGVRPLLPGRSHVDPGVLVDRLFEAVVDLLNDLMARTPVELLSDVNLSARDSQPSQASRAGGDLDPFAPWIRQSIRLQLGF
jgi:hypothetical protein